MACSPSATVRRPRRASVTPTSLLAPNHLCRFGRRRSKSTSPTFLPAIANETARLAVTEVFPSFLYELVTTTVGCAISLKAARRLVRRMRKASAWATGEPSSRPRCRRFGRRPNNSILTPRPSSHPGPWPGSWPGCRPDRAHRRPYSGGVQGIEGDEPESGQFQPDLRLGEAPDGQIEVVAQGDEAHAGEQSGEPGGCQVWEQPGAVGTVG